MVHSQVYLDRKKIINFALVPSALVYNLTSSLWVVRLISKFQQKKQTATRRFSEQTYEAQCVGVIFVTYFVV